MSNKTCFAPAFDSFCLGIGPRVILSAMLLCRAFSVHAAENQISVDSSEELYRAVEGARPGQTIVVEDGDYVLTRDLIITCSGSAGEMPIVLKSKNRGKAVLRGQAAVRFNGVRHFRMEGFAVQLEARSFGERTAVISLVDCRNVQVSANTLRITEPDAVVQSDRQVNWVGIFSTAAGKSGDNVVFANDFSHKRARGDFVIVIGIKDGCPSQNDRISRNLFSDFPPPGRSGANGYESIRIGTNVDGNQSLNYGTIIEANLFDNCSAEPEIISIKGGAVTIRSNTFIDCAGAVSLRSGNGSSVTHNVFIAQGEGMGMGGVRMYGSGHLIGWNYFQGLAGTGMNASPLGILHGAPAGSGLLGGADGLPAQGCLVTGNTWVNCSALLFGYESRERVLPPRDCLFTGNTLVSTIPGSQALILCYQADGIAVANTMVYSSPSRLTGLEALTTFSSSVTILPQHPELSLPRRLTAGEVGPAWISDTRNPVE